ncbi:MAG TPA: ABC transporter ATP-binding protein [Steroidobacteraceae bacterium]|nr:ABC transporter ATP-binding protein [Steroidobacteraceae bacterium]
MRLSGISYRAGSELWLRDIDLSLATGGINVLLGATLAGKTTLLRIMAGLDRPTTGRLLDGDRDLTGVPVRQRNVAMVYQQFINYPSLTVYENIASPLRVARKSASEIETRVTQLAETLRLTQFLSRYPAELSGGQQQRTALARALAKDAELLLLDEPLINLDYKLREELRAELTQLFAGGRTTVVYATTEPLEALQLGGHTTLLAEGRVLQSGPTLEVFRRPATLEAARAFSDPPLNVIPASAVEGMRLPSGAAAATDVLLGVRAHEFSLAGASGQIALRGRVELAEISGSETFIHLARDDVRLVAQIPGVHDLPLNEPCTLYIRPTSLYGFDRSGRLLFAPES